MNVGFQTDDFAINIVGGGKFFTLSARANRYILTLVYWFTRYAITGLSFDKSSEAVINAVFGNFITVYSTPRRILTEPSNCFESILFQSF